MHIPIEGGYVECFGAFPSGEGDDAIVVSLDVQSEDCLSNGRGSGKVFTDLTRKQAIALRDELNKALG